MSGTPGQAAFEVLYRAEPSAWEVLDDRQRARWEAAAQAAITAYLAAQSGPWAERAKEILTEGHP